MMKRWKTKEGREIENVKIDDFLFDIISVCEKHGLSISHEDHYGAFEIELFSKNRCEWLLNANDKT